MKRIIRFPLACLSIVFISACTIIPSTSAVDTYQLPPSTVNIPMNGTPLSLMVATPYANRYLNHQRLVVVQSNHELQSYTGMRWEDELPTMFRNRLIDDLRRVQAYRSVVNDKEAVVTDRVLRTDLLAYQLQFNDKQPFALISVDASLYDANDLTVISTKRFSVNAPLNSVNLKEVIPAFAKLNDTINTQIIQWVVSQ